jgi:hypothetical protein
VEKCLFIEIPFIEVKTVCKARKLGYIINRAKLSTKVGDKTFS